MGSEHTRRLVRLIRTQRWAALATVNQGAPLASMVAYAPEQDLASLLLHLSRLASHTGNLLKTGTASLAISEPDPGEGDPQTLARVSISGSVHGISRDAPEYAALKERYLTCVPTAEPLFGFDDFILFRLQPMEVRYVGGFAQAYTLDAEGFRQAVWSVDS